MFWAFVSFCLLSLKECEVQSYPSIQGAGTTTMHSNLQFYGNGNRRNPDANERRNFFNTKDENIVEVKKEGKKKRKTGKISYKMLNNKIRYNTGRGKEKSIKFSFHIFLEKDNFSFHLLFPYA